MAHRSLSITRAAMSFTLRAPVNAVASRRSACVRPRAGARAVTVRAASDIVDTVRRYPAGAQPPRPGCQA